MYISHTWHNMVATQSNHQIVIYMLVAVVVLVEAAEASKGVADQYGGHPRPRPLPPRGWLEKDPRGAPGGTGGLPQEPPLLQTKGLTYCGKGSQRN